MASDGPSTGQCGREREKRERHSGRGDRVSKYLEARKTTIIQHLYTDDSMCQALSWGVGRVRNTDPSPAFLALGVWLGP